VKIGHTSKYQAYCEIEISKPTFKNKMKKILVPIEIAIQGDENRSKWVAKIAFAAQYCMMIGACKIFDEAICISEALVNPITRSYRGLQNLCIH
jgi:hypothetical protein